MDFSIALYGLLGAALGGGATYFLQSKKVMALERANAELTAQVKAEKEALERAGSELDNRFKATAAQIMQQSNEQFLQLAQERLKGAQGDAAHDLDKRQKAIDEMVKPVQEHLKTMAAALEQVKGTDQSLTEQVKHLNRETARLVGALRDPSAQGVWGEFILEGVLENSGLIKGLHYHTQVSYETEGGRQRPDAVIKMQDGFNIIVDAKAPINEFAQRLSEDLSEQDYNDI